MAVLVDMYRAMVRLKTSGGGTKRSDRVRRLLVAAICLAASCAGTSAVAACSFSSGGRVTGNIAFGKVAIPGNPAVGTVLAETSSTYGALTGTQTYTCGVTTNTVLFAMSGTSSSGIYSTSVAGIGVRITVSGQGGLGFIGTYVTPYSFSFAYGGNTGYNVRDVSIKTQLVVTGPIDRGGAALAYAANPWLVISGGGDQLAVSDLVVSATLALSGCSVTTPSVSADLPPVFPGNFATGYAGVTPVVLGLNCAPGAKISATLTDASTPSNRSTVLSLAPGSTARGVGLQVLKDAAPVSYGPDSAVAGNPNQWSVGTAKGGPLSIPLTVRYARTTGALSAGSVKGVATFTMSYQ